MFWDWLLKYSPLLVTGAVSLVVGLILHRLTTKTADLIYYTSHVQYVPIPPQQGQQQQGPIGTFTLFIWNNGGAPARDLHVGHVFLPANNVYPDIPRNIVNTPGGGVAIQFPILPPKTLVSISYLFFGVFAVENILSYVGWEEGTAKRIPVMLQRIWPKWLQYIVRVLFFAGLWVAVNAAWSLVRFLWLAYYVK
jgi:hypothetical protein